MSKAHAGSVFADQFLHVLRNQPAAASAPSDIPCSRCLHILRINQVPLLLVPQSAGLSKARCGFKSQDTEGYMTYHQNLCSIMSLKMRRIDHDHDAVPGFGAGSVKYAAGYDSKNSKSGSELASVRRATIIARIRSAQMERSSGTWPLTAPGSEQRRRW